MKTIKQYCKEWVKTHEYPLCPAEDLIRDIANDREFGKGIKTERGLVSYLNRRVPIMMQDLVLDAVPEFMIMYKESV